jgi:hypothetical protein
MGRFSFRGQPDSSDEASVDEDVVVRQYRYLLRTAPADALEAAHVDAIPVLSQAHQESLLETVQRSLLVGGHLTTSHHAKIAHLVTAGEQRAPGQLLQALPAEVLKSLAAAVLDSEASFGLLGGYASWDGAEPQPADHPDWADGGFNPQVGQGRPLNDPRTSKGYAAGGP